MQDVKHAQHKPAKAEQPCCSETQCLPCDFETFCRNAYFTGKLLTERDFVAEQRYFIDKARLHQRALHGWGIVCGLTLAPHPYCPQLRIVIEPGLAVDSCGRDIFIPERIEWQLPRVEPEAPAKNSCPPERQQPTGKHPHGNEKNQTNHHADAMPLREEYRAAPAQHRHDRPEECGCDTDLYLSLCYTECETELVPAPFDECACNGISKRPNRICERYRIEWSTERPKDWPRPRQCEEDDCSTLYERMRQACAEPGAPRCIPLAVIRGYEEGQPVTAEMIDYRDRRQLASTQLLDDLIRCILGKLPTKRYTHIEDINWEHGLQYTCKQFSQLFGGEASDAALEVRFTASVRTDTLSTRSFQAIIVHHGEERHEGGYMEVAPAKVWASTDRQTFYLKIDPGYAEHCLRRGSFDVFVTLRCNVLIDDRGLVVDGNLLARLNGDDVIVGPPTGDGIPGGTFESWFRVLE
jgi:hypothetical protein